MIKLSDYSSDRAALLASEFYFNQYNPMNVILMAYHKGGYNTIGRVVQASDYFYLDLFTPDAAKLKLDRVIAAGQPVSQEWKDAWGL